MRMADGEVSHKLRSQKSKNSDRAVAVAEMCENREITTVQNEERTTEE